jgi:hypothetical protein
MMSLDAIIDYSSREPVRPSQNAKPIADISLQASAYSIADAENALLTTNHQISMSTVDEIIKREGDNPAVVQRALVNFFSTVQNPDTNRPTEHLDLLPAGHPLSTTWVSSFSKRQTIADYMAEDARLPENARPLVASAIYAEPNTAQRKYYEAKLNRRGLTMLTSGIIATADKAISGS